MKYDWLGIEDSKLRSNLYYLTLILENDPRFRGVAAFNEFTGELVQRGSPKLLPKVDERYPTHQLKGASWHVRDPLNGDHWGEHQDHAIRSLIEAPPKQGGYGIRVSDRDLRSSLDCVARANGFHPVREYLQGLEWDGRPRIERLFIDYLGTPDDPYHRKTAAIFLTAAVTRILEPGHKFDFAVILEGSQGKRKSTFIRTLGKHWFTELDGDPSNTQQMVECMQGAWIIEVPELAAFTRSEVVDLKAFMSRSTDKVRPAYAKRAQYFPRQCVFIGSTNDLQYLKDDTGGRRFWPIRCRVLQIDTVELEGNVDQIWAEAVHMYRLMRRRYSGRPLPLFLNEQVSALRALQQQEGARIETAADAYAGVIESWLDHPVRSIEEDSGRRDRACLQEIWCECFGGDPNAYNQSTAQLLGQAMKLLPEWEVTGERFRTKRYGQQRLYRRKLTV